jgi:hypothetical protein
MAAVFWPFCVVGLVLDDLKKGKADTDMNQAVLEAIFSTFVVFYLNPLQIH